MADKAHKATDEILEEMERRLSAIYSKAQKETGKAWKECLDESGKEIADLQKAYDDAKKSGDDALIKKTGYRLGRAKQERTLQDKRFKDLTAQLAADVSHVNETALAYVNGELPGVYALNYNALEDTVSGDLGGYSFTLTDANTVKSLAESDKNLLPYKEIDGRLDVRWNVKKINAEVLQGILQGESMDKIAGRFSKVMEMNRVSAIRNARTTVTGAENKGRQDSYEKATSDGIQLEREWISTNDGRTRHAHRLLDGETAPVNKPFQSELGEIMYPGDPHADPGNVYNCRCTIAARVIGFEKKAAPPDDDPEEFDPFEALMNPEYAKKNRTKYVEKSSAFGQNGIADSEYPEDLRLSKKESERMSMLEKYFSNKAEKSFRPTTEEVRAIQGIMSEEIIESSRAAYIADIKKAEEMIKLRKEEGYKGRSKKENYEKYKELQQELKGADEFEKSEVLESFRVGESGIRYWQILKKESERNIKGLEFALKILRRKKYAEGKGEK